MTRPLSVFGMHKNVLPYSQWADLPKRKAAKSAGTRQNIRRAEFIKAFRSVSREFAGEPRAARRRMARALSKRGWPGQQPKPAAVAA